MSGSPRKPPEHGMFKKGQSGNPKGRPKLLDESRGIPKMTAEDLKRMISRYFRMTSGELRMASVNSNTSVLELCIAATLTRAIAIGDFSRISILIERVIGKVQDASTITVNYDTELEEVAPHEIVAYLRARAAQVQQPPHQDIEI